MPSTPPQEESGCDPSEWAAKWKTVGARAWRDFNGLVDSQEKAIAEGHGRLDGVTSLAQLSFPEKLYVDAGVVVLPQNVTEREVYLIGDLHGDYESLDALLQLTGLENSRSRPLLVFLGDYGDRGEDSLAVWLRLAQIKGQFPEDVVLLRGNHEDLIKVQSIRESDGKALSQPWYVPAVTYNDTYVALGFALESNFANLSAVFESLPAMALFPDGMLAVHGGPVPRWKEGDGWKLPLEEKDALRIGTLADLRKPRAQFVMRWVDVLDRDDVDLAWTEYGGSSRLSAAALDLAEWRDRLGIKRFVHGHTHPQSGFEWACGQDALAVNTSLATGQCAVIVKWKPDGLEPIPLKSA